MKLSLMLASISLALSFSAVGAGPVGIGQLKLGMTYSAVEVLRVGTDGIELGLITPDDYKKGEPKEDQQEFVSLLTSPLSSAPLKVNLTFQAGQLIMLAITLEDVPHTLARVKTQITEKYGPGSVKDGRTEKQCIYRSGANFKILSGSVDTQWTEPLSPTERIVTTLWEHTSAACPADLRYGTVGSTELQRLFIYKLNDATITKPKNPF